MYRKIFNDQRLKTWLATKDLTVDNQFRKSSVEIEVHKQEMEKSLAHMAQQMIELDDEANYNFSGRMNSQKYNSKIEMDTAVAREMVAKKTDDTAPATQEPCPTPNIDMDDLRIFQDSFVQAIKEEDMYELPQMIKHAMYNYPDVMEGLICWAELVIKKVKEAPAIEEKRAEDIAKIKLDPVEIMFHRNLKGTLVPN